MSNRRTVHVVVAASALLLAACSSRTAPGTSEATEVSSEAFSCGDVTQRLACDAPSDPSLVYVCHATGSAKNPYVKLIEPVAKRDHVVGGRHSADRPPDVAPGASGTD